MGITAERNHDGSYTITAIINDTTGQYRESKQFYGYTKKEAIAIFRERYGKFITQERN